MAARLLKVLLIKCATSIEFFIGTNFPSSFFNPNLLFTKAVVLTYFACNDVPKAELFFLAF